MANGFCSVQRKETGERHVPPVSVVLLPVERCAPTIFAHRGPTISEPVHRIAVAARLDEFEILAVCHRPRGERVVTQQHVVARGFVVKCEAASVMTDLCDTALALDPPEWRDRFRSRRQLLLVGRPEGIHRKVVLDVHEQEFLMLLLVVESQGDAAGDVAPALLGNGVHEREHRLVDMRAVAIDLLHRGAGEQPSLRARMKRAEGLVIGIEQVLEARMERKVAGRERLQQKSLEEPRDVGEVPLGRARFEHALHLVVVHRERRAKTLGLGAHLLEARHQIHPVHGSCRWRIHGRSSGARVAARGLLLRPGEGADQGCFSTRIWAFCG